MMRMLSIDAAGAVFIVVQDSSVRVTTATGDTLTAAATQADSATTAAVDQPVLAQPVMRTPENGGYLKIAYGAAAFIYISYLVLLRRRWTALRARQNRNTLHARR